MRLTKNDMSRVIVAALYNLPALPEGDHPKVVKMARCKADHLRSQHKLALEVINSRILHSDHKAAVSGACPKCGDDSLPVRLTGTRNALCDDCLGAHLDVTDA